MIFWTFVCHAMVAKGAQGKHVAAQFARKGFVQSKMQKEQQGEKTKQHEVPCIMCESLVKTRHTSNKGHTYEQLFQQHDCAPNVNFVAECASGNYLCELCWKAAGDTLGLDTLPDAVWDTVRSLVARTTSGSAVVVDGGIQWAQDQVVRVRGCQASFLCDGRAKELETRLHGMEDPAIILATVKHFYVGQTLTGYDADKVITSAMIQEASAAIAEWGSAPKAAAVYKWLVQAENGSNFLTAFGAWWLAMQHARLRPELVGAFRSALNKLWRTGWGPCLTLATLVPSAGAVSVSTQRSMPATGNRRTRDKAATLLCAFLFHSPVGWRLRELFRKHRLPCDHPLFLAFLCCEVRKYTSADPKRLRAGGDELLRRLMSTGVHVRSHRLAHASVVSEPPSADEWEGE